MLAHVSALVVVTLKVSDHTSTPARCGSASVWSVSDSVPSSFSDSVLSSLGSPLPPTDG